MDKLERVFNIFLNNLPDDTTKNITTLDLLCALQPAIQACQEPELTKENIEKIKNGSHTTLYTSKRLGVEEIGMDNNLCDTCIRVYSECMHNHENLPIVEFASEDNDAIVNCDWYIRKPKEINNAITGE